MNRAKSLLLPLLLLCTLAGAQNKTVKLYPNGQGKLSNGITTPEVYNSETRILTDVGDGARVDFYFPQKNCGKMVLICPGGGYGVLAVSYEGSIAAKWLNDRGIAAAVLKYRMPHGVWDIPITDVHNAMRLCRKEGRKLGISKIGIMGFSAGGHLAATGSNIYRSKKERPDFSILFYPVISMKEGVTHRWSRAALLGEEPSEELIERFSIEDRVTSNTPPAFMAITLDDETVKVENTRLYSEAMHRCGVSCEVVEFPTGGHGFGFHGPGEKDALTKQERAELDRALESWLKDR